MLAGPGTSRSANDLKTKVDIGKFVANYDAGDHKLKLGAEFNRADIFNLFVQVEHRPDNGGLGLGLSLVQQLVTLHRGEVSVFSTGEAGKGSEFVVSLPTIATPAD